MICESVARIPKMNNQNRKEEVLLAQNFRILLEKFQIRCMKTKVLFSKASDTYLTVFIL